MIGIPGLIPEKFPEWPHMEFMTLVGRTIVKGRRNGVTVQLVSTADGWTVTKMHKGQVLAEKTITRLPSDLWTALERRRRHEQRQHAEARPWR